MLLLLLLLSPRVLTSIDTNCVGDKNKIVSLPSSAGRDRGPASLEREADIERLPILAQTGAEFFIEQIIRWAP